MYKFIIRPLFFLLSPETIHHLTVNCIRISKYIPFLPMIMRLLFRVNHPVLKREVLGLNFPNPVGLPAGFDKDAEVYNELYNFGFGFVEVGTIPPQAQEGNPKPRVFRSVKDKAIINRMGFPSKGKKYCVANLKKGKKHDFILAGNIGKNSNTTNQLAVDDYLASFRALYEYVDFFVVNLSCPNVKDLTKLQDMKSQIEIIEALIKFRRGQNEYRPILIKISPDLSKEQIDDTIEVINITNIDGIVATNTTTSREGLTISQEKIDAIANGGMSGATLTKKAIEIVRYIHEKTNGKLPIIGVGGIMSVQDAVDMLNAGASLIQIYSGFIYNGPTFAKDICKELVKQHKTKKKAQKAKIEAQKISNAKSH